MLDVDTIPISIGSYLAGFTDGEGSFNISFRPRGDYKSGWKISACFNISNKDLVILQKFKEVFKCGTLRSRPDDVWYFEINNLPDLIESVIPFFRRFGFISAKKTNDFAIFCKIVSILQSQEHRSEKAIREILEMRNLMNGGGKRKYSDTEILSRLKESSETNTPNLHSLHMQDDRVRSSWRHEATK